MIERLSGADRLVLGADASWPQDVGALAILDGAGLLDRDGAIDTVAIRDALARRLHLVPRFRQRVLRLRRGLGGPIWVDHAAFDVSDHIRVRPLPAGSGDEALLRAAESIRRHRLSINRPAWEVWLLPGLRGGRIGLFLRIHHVVADGRAALTMLGALFEADPSAPPLDPPLWSPAPPPSTRELLVDNTRRRLAAVVAALGALARPWAGLQRLRRAAPGMRELMAESPGDETSLDRMIGPERRFAIVRERLHDIRAIGRAHGASVNDVLLAAAAAGLRTLLMYRGEPVDDVSLRVFVPVSLRGRLRGRVEGNDLSQMVVPIALGTTDPVERLRAITRETTARKGRTRTPPTILFRYGVVRRFVLRAIIGQRVNVTSASLSGPRKPLYLAGARVLDLFPVLNLIGNQTIGVGVISYAGAFEICITADAGAVPDVDVVAAGMRNELAALASGVPRGMTAPNVQDGRRQRGLAPADSVVPALAGARPMT